MTNKQNDIDAAIKTVKRLIRHGTLVEGKTTQAIISALEAQRDGGMGNVLGDKIISGAWNDDATKLTILTENGREYIRTEPQPPETEVE